tara:strand:- start:50 stop:1015 length:966 start_codon:yes stop_codon:yes gene_type:complete
MPNYQGVWSLSTQYQNRSGWPYAPPSGDSAIIFGASQSGTPPLTAGIQFQNFASGGSMQTFGDLAHIYGSLGGAMGNSTFAIQGFIASPAENRVDIKYVTISSMGNQQTWGELGRSAYAGGATSNSTRGLWWGGVGASAYIQYMTLSSTGNATDFGTIAETNYQQNAALCSTTRAISCGGYGDNVGAPEYAVNSLWYVTIANTGNAADFGDMTRKARQVGASGSNTRGLFSGGYNNNAFAINVIDYVTIASTGNASDFGDLTVAGRTASTSNKVVSINYGIQNTNTINKVTIDTTGNATDFGDMSVLTEATATSNAHGGLA